MLPARPTVSAIKTRLTDRPRPLDSPKVHWGFETTYHYQTASVAPQTSRIPAVTRSEQKILDCILDLREVFGLELPEEEAKVMRRRKRSYAVSSDLFEANQKGESVHSFEFDMEGMSIDPPQTKVSMKHRAPPALDHFSFSEDPEGYQMKLIEADREEVQREEPRVFLRASSQQLWAVATEAIKSLSLKTGRLLSEARSMIRHLSHCLARLTKSWLTYRLPLKKVEQRPARSEGVSLNLHRSSAPFRGLTLEPSDLDIQAEDRSIKTGIFSLTTLPSSPSNSPISSDKESPESPLRSSPVSDKKTRPRKCSSQGKKLRNINFALSRNRRGKEIPLSMSEEFGDQIRRSSYRALLVSS